MPAASRFRSGTRSPAERSTFTAWSNRALAAGSAFLRTAIRPASSSSAAFAGSGASTISRENTSAGSSSIESVSSIRSLASVTVRPLYLITRSWSFMSFTPSILMGIGVFCVRSFSRASQADVRAFSAAASTPIWRRASSTRASAPSRRPVSFRFSRPSARISLSSASAVSASAFTWTRGDPSHGDSAAAASVSKSPFR
jgi:hypothetical protein